MIKRKKDIIVVLLIAALSAVVVYIGVRMLTRKGGDDVSVALSTSYGWSQTFGGANNEVLTGMDVAPDGGIFLSGDFSGTVDFDPGAGSNTVTADSPSGYGGTYGFFNQLNANGGFVRRRTIGNSILAGHMTDVELSPDGNFVYTSGWLVGDSASGLAYLGKHTTTSSSSGSDFNFSPGWENPQDSSVLPHKIVTAPNGDVYYAGRWDFGSSPVDFNPTSSGQDMKSCLRDNGAISNRCLFISRYNSSGQYVSTMIMPRIAVANANIDLHDMKISPDGQNIILAGDFRGTYDFDPSSSSFELIGPSDNSGTSQPFVSSININGSLNWAVTYDGLRVSPYISVAVGTQNEVYVHGVMASTGNVDYDPTSGTDTRAAGLFTTRINANGSYAWTNTLPLGGVSSSGDIEFFNGNIYAAGSFKVSASTFDFDPTSGVDTKSISPVGAGLYVTSYASNGGYNMTYVNPTFTGTGNTITDLEVTSNAIFIAGVFSGSPDFDPGSGVDTKTANGGRDVFVTKLNLVDTNASSSSSVVVSSSSSSSIISSSSSSVSLSGPGGACTTTANCQSGLTCNNGVCQGPAGTECGNNSNACISPLVCVNGVCANPVGPGGACGETADCQTGLTCNNGVCQGPAGTTCTTDAACINPLVCVNGSCANPVGPGGACGETADCQSGLTCNNGVCQGPVGTACTSNNACISPLVCINGQCSNQSGNGGSCDETADCQSGLVCTNGICQAGSGGSCTNNAGCTSPLVCVNNTCTNTSGPGGTCDEQADCQTGLTCNNGVCQGPIGTACGTNDNACISPLVCVNGSCANPVGPGGACGETADCQTGLTCNNGVCQGPIGTACGTNDNACISPLVCVNGSCANPVGPGGACGETADCQAGLTCNNGVCQGPAGTACSSDAACISPLTCQNGTCQNPVVSSSSSSSVVVSSSSSSSVAPPASSSSSSTVVAAASSSSTPPLPNTAIGDSSFMTVVLLGMFMIILGSLILVNVKSKDSVYVQIATNEETGKKKISGYDADGFEKRVIGNNRK